MNILNSLVSLAIILCLAIVFVINGSAKIGLFGFGVPYFLGVIIFMCAGTALFLLAMPSLYSKIFLKYSRLKKERRDNINLRKAYSKALLHALLGDKINLAEDLEDLFRRDQEDPETGLTLGSVYRELGEVNRAIEVHGITSRLNPQNYLAFLELGKDYESAGDKESALKYWKTARELAPKELPPKVLIRDYLLDKGMIEEASGIQKEILDMPIEDEVRDEERDMYAQILCALGQKQIAEKKYQEAVNNFKTVMGIDRNFASAYVLCGDAFLEAGNAREAVNVWSNGFRLVRLSVLFHRVRKSYEKDNNPAAWEDFVRKMISEFPGDHRLYIELGIIFYTMKNADEAVRQFRKAAEVNPKAESSHRCLGDVYFAGNDFENSSREYKKAVNAYVDSIIDSWSCRNCGNKSSSWNEVCGNCGAWNALMQEEDRYYLRT